VQDVFSNRLCEFQLFKHVLFTGGSQDPNDKGDGSQGNDEKTSRAEKRKAMVDNLLDPNADLPANKKMRPDPFSSR
jgi:hypothetical protein